MENRQVLRRNMILKGNLTKTILIICLPLALYQFFNSLFVVIDQIISANISADAQNAVSSIGQIKNTISAFGGGLAAGGCVLVARYYGAGDLRRARHSSSNLFMMSIVLSLIIILIFVPFSSLILKACQIAPASRKIGNRYFQLQMIELIFVSLNSIFIGLEKAKGNSRIILFLNMFVLVIKLSLTCLFVYGFNLKDIIYVELATIIAQGILTIIGLIILFNKKNILHLNVKMLWFKSEYVKLILILSIPIFFGKFIMSLGKVVVNAMCGYYWNAVTDGLIVGSLGISNNLSGLITSPTNTFEEGESTIVSQNLGNKNMKRTLKAFFRTLIIVSIISITGWILLRFILCDYIVELFTIAKKNKATDPTDLEKLELTKEMVKKIFVFDSLSIPSLGIAAAVLGLLYGYGQTILSTIFNFTRIGSRIVILFILHYTSLNDNPTLCAGLSMGISNIIILLTAVIFLIIFLLKIKKKGYKGMHFSDPEPEVSELFDEDEEFFNKTSINIEVEENKLE